MIRQSCTIKGEVVCSGLSPALHGELVYRHGGLAGGRPVPQGPPETAQGREGPGEQQVVRPAELGVHHCVEQRVDAAVEPGQVDAEHVEDLRSTAPLVGQVQQQERDEAEHETQEDGETHSGHSL